MQILTIQMALHGHIDRSYIGSRIDIKTTAAIVGPVEGDSGVADPRIGAQPYAAALARSLIAHKKTLSNDASTQQAAGIEIHPGTIGGAIIDDLHLGQGAAIGYAHTAAKIACGIHFKLTIGQIDQLGTNSAATDSGVIAHQSVDDIDEVAAIDRPTFAKKGGVVLEQAAANGAVSDADGTRITARTVIAKCGTADQ